MDLGGFASRSRRPFQIASNGSTPGLFCPGAALSRPVQCIARRVWTGASGRTGNGDAMNPQGTFQVCTPAPAGVPCLPSAPTPACQPFPRENQGKWPTFISWNGRGGGLQRARSRAESRGVLRRWRNGRQWLSAASGQRPSNGPTFSRFADDLKRVDRDRTSTAGARATPCRDPSRCRLPTARVVDLTPWRDQDLPCCTKYCMNVQLSFLVSEHRMNDSDFNKQLRQHYRPVMYRLPAWLSRVWAWL